MKKLLLIMLIAGLALCGTAIAQPLAFKYQAVARGANGALLINKSVALRISIRQGSAAGSIEYQETHTTTTNAYGLLTIDVGAGTAVNGTFAGINWSDPGQKYIQTEINLGSGYLNMGASKLLSVPYAINALGAKPTGAAGGDLSGSYPNPSIANGAVTPAKMANINTASILGRSSAGAGSPEVLTAAAARTVLSVDNVDNTSDANKPVSTATQSALNLKANTASPTFTGTVTLPATTSAGSVSATELGYLDGVTSPIQTQINALGGSSVNSVTGTANKITSSGGANPVIDIAGTYIGQPSITTLGTVATGTWNADVIAASKGGAGSTNGILKANGLGAVSAATAEIDYLTPTGSAASLTSFPILNQNTTGNAATATLATTVTTNANMVGDVTSSGNTTTYNNVVPAAKGGAGTITGLLKANGSGTVSAATAGTDYLVPSGNGSGLTALNATQLTSGTIPAAAMPALSGDITSTAGSTATSLAANTVTTAKIADGNVTLAKMANVSTASLLGRNTAGAGAPEVLSTSTAKTLLALNNVDNTSDAGKPISTSTQTALDLKANLAAPTFTGTVVLPSSTSVGSVTATEIGYLSGVTSAIQTQLNTKGAGTVTGVTGTTNRITSSGGATPAIDIAGTYAGQTSITTLGTVATGTWNADVISASKGGAGTVSGILKANGSGTVSAATADTDYLSPTGSAALLTSFPTLNQNTTGNAATATTASTVTTNANLTGDVTSTGNATTIASNAVTSAKLADGNVTLAKMANMATASILGRTTAGAGVPEVLSAATTKSLLSLNNVDNTSDAGKPVSTATQTALDLKANLAAPTFTGTVVLPSTTSVGSVTATELGYVGGVTSAIQTQLNAKGSGTVTGVSGTTNRITSSGGATPAIDISSSYVGQTSITTLGTVATGTWNADVIGATKGGAGSVNGILKAVGTGTVSAATAADITPVLPAFTGAITTTAGSVATSLATDAVTTVKIADANVTLAKMANIATASILGRSTAGTGVPEVLDASTTKTLLTLNNVDNTSDANKIVSTATQTALNLKADLASPTFTGTVALPSTTSIGSVTATELGYVGGVTSAIQTQLNAKGSGTVTGVSGTTNRITSSGGATPAIDISSSYVGQTSITTLGTVATGTWNADVISASKLTLSGQTAANITSGTFGAGNASNLTALNATQLTSGTVPTGVLGSGTANSTTFLRGDNTWAAAGGGGLSAGSTSGQVYLTGASGAVPTTPVSVSGDISITSGGVTAVASLPAISGVNLTSLNAGNLGSGTVPAGRMPALTGDVTMTAGTTATTIANNAVTVGKMATSGTLPAFNGSALTALNATQLTSGTVPAAAMPALTGNVTTTAGSTATTIASLPAISGASLTTLNAAELSSGTVPLARLGSSGTANSTTFLRGDNTWAAAGGGGLSAGSTSGQVYLTGASGAVPTTPVSVTGDISITSAGVTAVASLPAISGANLTALNAGNLGSGTVPAGRMPALTGDVTMTAGTTATTIANNAVTVGKMATSGTLPAFNGSALTNLDASDLATGTVPTARMGSGTANATTFLRGDQTWSVGPTVDLIAYMSSSQTIATSSTSDIQFNATTVSPTLGSFNTTNYTYTVGTGQTGNYQISITLAAVTPSNNPWIALYINGVATDFGVANNNSSLTDIQSRGMLTVIKRLTAADVVKVVCQNINAGNAINFNANNPSSFSIIKY